mmetsp:Transcript_6390/g.22480  ORF Transcript_6390/g.22480 Transcript_6390/m.22480 type:complete len:228 (-) Transcript_6390:578-1261(-)
MHANVHVGEEGRDTTTREIQTARENTRNTCGTKPKRKKESHTCHQRRGRKQRGRGRKERRRERWRGNRRRSAGWTSVEVARRKRIAQQRTRLRSPRSGNARRQGRRSHPRVPSTQRVRVQLPQEPMRIRFRTRRRSGQRLSPRQNGSRHGSERFLPRRSVHQSLPAQRGPARAKRLLDLENRRFPRKRDLRHVRHHLRRTPGSKTFADARKLGRVAVEKGLHHTGLL